ncbi:MAG: Ig-like domain-containing protein, partial [Phycicoccus sp.]
MARQGVARRAAVRQARRRTASTVAVVLVASGLGYAAVASQGSTVHETDLHDAGVWVSSDAQAKFAKANIPIGQLESGVATSVAAGSGLDLLQDGAAVIGVGTGAGQLFPIDPRTSTAGDSAAPVAAPDRVPGRFTASPVDLRGGTVALLDPDSGKVWAQRVDPTAGVTSLPGLSPSAKPLAEVGRTAAIAVDERGNVHAVSGATGRVTTVAVTRTGFAKPAVTSTELRSAAPDITAVGATWVAYDAGTDRLFSAATPAGFGAQVITPGGSRFAALQQPGPDADAVAVASSERARPVPLDGG